MINKKNIKEYAKLIKKLAHESLSKEGIKDALIFLFFLAISSLFWFIQELDENFGAELTVPVKLVGITDDAHITNDLPSNIRITVQDQGGELLAYFITGHTDTLRIQFRNDENETGHVMLQRDTLATLIKRLLPTTTEITSIAPGSIYYSYIIGAPVRLPVRLNGEIRTDAQFCIDSKTFDPDSVDVYASRDILATMKAVYTEKFDTSRITEDFEKTLALEKKQDVLIDCQAVRLRIVLGNMSHEEIELPIIGLNFPASKTLRTFPSTVKVSYYVPENMRKSINTDEFKVTITYADVKDNKTGRCNPRLNSQPEGISGVRIDPVDVGFLFENAVNSETEVGKKSKRK